MLKESYVFLNSSDKQTEAANLRQSRK